MRVPCDNSGCPNTFFPAANGYIPMCGPCARSHESKRVVDLYEGVEDPVQRIRIFYASHDDNRLVQYLPAPFDIVELFESLTAEELDWVEAMACSAKQHGETFLADNLARALAALTDHPLTRFQEACLAEGDPSPWVIFRNASQDVRDHIILALCASRMRVDSALMALAWIGDDTVVQAFAAWENRPIPPLNPSANALGSYAREAGWEFVGGQRRDLTFPHCVGIEPCPLAESDRAIKLCQPAGGRCKWCRQPLIYMVDLDLRDGRLAFLGWPGPRLAVLSCRGCTELETIFAKVGNDGCGRWHSRNRKPDEMPEDDPWPDHPWRHSGARLVPHRVRYPVQDFWMNSSQIGGMPGWMGEAIYPACPDCGVTMKFAAQVDRTHFNAEEGVDFIYLCARCRITAVNKQLY